MTKAQIAAALQTIVRLQLDDCKRAIKDGTKTIALNELEDAIRQLKLLYRPRLVRHRIECYAASAAGESWFCRTAAGVWNPCRSMSQVVL